MARGNEPRSGLGRLEGPIAVDEEDGELGAKGISGFDDQLAWPSHRSPCRHRASATRSTQSGGTK